MSTKLQTLLLESLFPQQPVKTVFLLNDHDCSLKLRISGTKRKCLESMTKCVVNKFEF